jgi:hypothetical protein
MSQTTKRVLRTPDHGPALLGAAEARRLPPTRTSA